MTKQARRRCFGSSYLRLDPAVPLPLLSWHHSSALPSLRRYEVESSWVREEAKAGQRGIPGEVDRSTIW
jgi:hypothetical protein